ncbi:MAG: flippase-like domain-containing protein [Flavobacteriales bacterium]|nr:flippase-like domain-containing protein [Flavobacteriales bacterium]
MEQLKKRWFVGFVYVSLIFLLVGLYREDYLVIPHIYSAKYLALSIASLCAGFIFNGLGWKKILDGTGYPISFANSISSSGLAVFGKYIPGKLWAMVGQGGYVVREYDYPKANIATIIVTAQVIALWIGLILSAIGLVFLGSFSTTLSWAIGIALLVFSGTIFTNLPAKAAAKLLKAMSKGEAVDVALDFKTVIGTALMYLITWCLWCMGFYFLVVSLSDGFDVEVTIGLSYALALLVGFLALIIPGGLGVREGVIVASLTYVGFDLQLATTISIASRLWYLCGEIFIFLLALIMDKRKA